MKTLKKLSKKQMEWLNYTYPNRTMREYIMSLLKIEKAVIQKAETKKEMDLNKMNYNYPYMIKKVMKPGEIPRGF